MKNLQETDLQRINFISLLDEEEIGNNQGDPDKEEKPPGTQPDEKKRL